MDKYKIYLKSENKDFISVYVELLTDDKGIASFSIDFPKKILTVLKCVLFYGGFP